MLESWAHQLSGEKVYRPETKQCKAKGCSNPNKRVPIDINIAVSVEGAFKMSSGYIVGRSPFSDEAKLWHMELASHSWAFVMLMAGSYSCVKTLRKNWL